MPSVFAVKPEPGADVPFGLITFLKDHTEQDVEIDLSSTKTLSGRHIEVLMAAHLQWQDAGSQVKLTHLNNELLEQLIGLGLPANLFSEGE